MNDRRDFFSKRRGADALSAALIALAGLILLLVLAFASAKGRFWALLALLPLGVAAYRILSLNLERRERENEAFLAFFLGIKGNARLLICRIRDRHTHIYFRCPCCRRALRVARAQGEIRVCCPNCRTVSGLDTGSAPASLPAADRDSPD